MKKIFLFFPVALFTVLVLFSSCKKDTGCPGCRTGNITPAVDPGPHLLIEREFTNTHWIYFHSPNDPSGSFDEFFLPVSGVAFPAGSFSVYFKRTISSNWEIANPPNVPGGPAVYHFNRADSTLSVWTSPDLSLVGVGGVIKIAYYTNP